MAPSDIDDGKLQTKWDEAQDYFLCSLSAHLRVIVLDLKALTDKPVVLARLEEAIRPALDEVQAELRKRSGLA